MRRRTRNTTASRRAWRSATATCSASTAPSIAARRTISGVTRIGNDNLFMAYSHVAHDCVLGNNIVFANCATLGGHVELGDWVIMGGSAGVHQFCKVGAHAFIANNAVVTRDVPPYVHGGGPSGRAALGQRRRPEAPRLHASSRSAISAMPIACCIARDLKLAEAVARLERAGRAAARAARRSSISSARLDPQPGAMNAAGRSDDRVRCASGSLPAKPPATSSAPR